MKVSYKLTNSKVKTVDINLIFPSLDNKQMICKGDNISITLTIEELIRIEWKLKTKATEIMIKSDTLKLDVTVENDEVFIKTIYSNIVRYGLDELSSTLVPLKNFLQTVETVLNYHYEKEFIEPSDSLITIELLKTSAKITCDGHFLQVKLKDLITIFTNKVEELYIMGIIKTD